MVELGGLSQHVVAGNELGLTYPQWIAVLSLGEQDDQTVSELGNKVFLESNTLMCAEYEKIGGEVYKRYRIFQKSLV